MEEQDGWKMGRTESADPGALLGLCPGEDMASMEGSLPPSFQSPIHEHQGRLMETADERMGNEKPARSISMPDALQRRHDGDDDDNHEVEREEGVDGKQRYGESGGSIDIKLAGARVFPGRVSPSRLFA